MNWTRYDPVTGRPDNTGHCRPEDYELQERFGLSLIAAACDLHRDYVDVSADPPAITPRPALSGFDRLEIAADDTDAARLALDRPFTVTIDGTPHAIDQPDDSGAYVAEITVSIPGEYRIGVEAWPALPYDATLTAS